MTVSRGSLSPTFASGTLDYDVSVGNDVLEINVTATVADSTATFTINGVSKTSAVEAGPYSLVVGDNEIEIVVTAEDGTSTTYTVTVNRAACKWFDLISSE